jgi:NAD(P)-dependent dehydrogenase (short-subunit alcohol dehydrogenase family)
MRDSPVPRRAFSFARRAHTFATNCLGHCLLHNLLLDDIQAEGRIVFTASGTRDSASMYGRLTTQSLEVE